MANNTNLKNYFNLLSKTYFINEFASFFITNYMRRKLIKKIKILKNKSILDIMSGKGENLKYINQRQNNTTITTIDFANKMNVAARLKNQNKIIKQIEKDFFINNEKSESFDIILCSFGIKTIEKDKIKLFAKKINHLLKANGEILLLEMVKPKRKIFLRFVKFYLNNLLPFIFGHQFKLLFPYVNKHKNMNDLSRNLSRYGHLEIIEHTRIFDFFEIIHAKKK